MNTDLLKIISLFVISIILTFAALAGLLSLIPNAHLDPLSAALGVTLPESLYNESMTLKGGLLITAISVISVGFVILNVYFGAVITSHFIHPRVSLVTSTRGVLSDKWNAIMPHVLIRLANFHKFNLADVRMNIVLTVEEVRSNGIKDEQFLCYLPIKEFTPQNILVMETKMPWTIAVPGDILLSNSLTRDYRFKPGQPITSSFSAGKTLGSVKRTLEILIQGVDTHSYSDFVIHRKILVDEQQGDQYTLHLHKGAFKSLPLHIALPAELEQYVA